MNKQETTPFLLCEATGETFTLPDAFTIGRSKNSQLIIDNNRVSRTHGIIRSDHGTCLYIDLNSANGSRVDGRRIEPNHPIALHHGSVIKIANRQFIFCEKDDPDICDKTVVTRGDKFTGFQKAQLKELGQVEDAENLSENAKTVFEENQQTNLRNQLDLIKGGDPQLVGYLKTGIDQVVDAPDQALFQCRFIVQRALDLIIHAEFPTGNVPDEWIRKWQSSPVYFKDNQIWNGKVPDRVALKMALLRVMTGAKGVDPVATFLGKESYLLLESLQSVSLPAGHPEAGYFRKSSFAISKMNDGVTLCELLAEEFASNISPTETHD